VSGLAGEWQLPLMKTIPDMRHAFLGLATLWHLVCFAVCGGEGGGVRYVCVRRVCVRGVCAVCVCLAGGLYIGFSPAVCLI